MGLFSAGLRWGGREHRWERRTNYALIIGIISTGAFYYFQWSFPIPYFVVITTSEVGLFFLILAGICHLFARLSHGAEQVLLKKARPWRK